MFVSELTSIPVAGLRGREKGEGASVRLIRAIVVRWNRHGSLMAWNRNLQRPACCSHLPSRVWCRHSALLTLRAGGPLR
jgi:hypothetical protein